MAAKLGSVFSQLRAHIGRGANLDTELLGFVRQAVQHAEANYSYRYMYQMTTGTFATGASSVSFATGFKEVDYLNVLASGRYFPLERKYPDFLPRRITSATGYARPEIYTIDTEFGGRLYPPPDKTYAFQHRAAFKTDVNATGFSATGASHWLYRNAESFVVNYSLYLAGARLRNREMMAQYRLLASEARRVSLAADSRHQEADYESTPMQYFPGDIGASEFDYSED